MFIRHRQNRSFQPYSQKNCHPERSEGSMHPAREHNYYVYIMTNRSKTLYTGVSNNLFRRVWEHKQGVGAGFCTKYRLDRLAYFERFQYVGNAITREKQIKGWLRIRKIALIVAQNPAWRDLSADWYNDCRPERSA
jgi:putative endonuclease